MGTRKPLTARVIERAKPKKHSYSIADSTRGLRVSVRPHGTKSFVFRYQLDKIDHAMTLGHVDDLTLEHARTQALAARTLLRQRIDPLTRRSAVQASNEAKAQASKAAQTTFGEVASLWLQTQAKHWSERHHRKTTSLVNTSLLHKLAKTPIAKVDRIKLLAVLRERYDDGKRESARTARSIAGSIIEFAKSTDVLPATHPNAARELIGDKLLKKSPVTHRPALPQAQVGAFLLALDAAKQSQRISAQVHAATLTCMLTASREGAIRTMRWKHLKGSVWSVPAEDMKSKRPFTTFIPALALGAIKALPKGKPDDYVFKSPVTKVALSSNTLRLTLHRLGFPFTAHGFRSLITDWAHEQGRWHPEVVAKVLDHKLPELQAAYLRSDFNSQRQELLAAFADWCVGQLSEAARA